MTDQFPRGKLTEDDEGALAIQVFDYQGETIINFGKQISWIGMSPEQAIEFGQMIIDRANEQISRSEA